MSEIREDEIDQSVGLSRHLQVVRRQRWIIVPAFVAAILASVLFSALQSPVYSARSKIVIGQGNTLFQAQNGNVIQPFTATMADLVTSDIVARDVISALGLKTTPSSLLQDVSVATNPQTAVLTLTVDGPNPEDARRIAAQFSTTFVHLVQARFGHVQTGSTGAQTEQPVTATIFDPAHVIPGEVSPKLARNVAVAATLGLVLGLAAAFLLEQFEGRLRTRESMEAALGIPVIGRVPVPSLEHLAAPVSEWDEWPGVSDAYRTLRAVLSALTTGSRARTVLVTSPTADHGKEAVILGLAHAIASAGWRSLLIEGDLRESLLDSALQTPPPGLTNVLRGDVTLRKATSPVLTPPRTNGFNGQVDFMPSGANESDLYELLSSARMAELLEGATEEYDFVLIDAAPLLTVADALHLAHITDGVVLVVGQDRLRAREAKELRSLFGRLGAHPIGVIVTDSQASREPQRRPAWLAPSTVRSARLAASTVRHQARLAASTVRQQARLAASAVRAAKTEAVSTKTTATRSAEQTSTTSGSAGSGSKSGGVARTGRDD